MYKKLRYGLIALLAFVGLTASAQGLSPYWHSLD